MPGRALVTCLELSDGGGFPVKIRDLAASGAFPHA